MASEPGIFVVTAARLAAVQNLNASVWQPLPRQTVAEYAPGALDASPATETLHAWGVTDSGHNPTKWSALAKGDWVLFVAHKQYCGIAQVTYKDRLRDFALRTWGPTDEGRAWELVFFLTRPTRVLVPTEGSGPYLHDRYQGFSRISEVRLNLIREDFGSVDAFIRSRFPACRPEQSVTLADVREAVCAYEAGEGREFGATLLYDLIVDGKAYPPKAIYALAARRSLGRLLAPGEVDSGEHSASFYTLASLGLAIAKRSDS